MAISAIDGWSEEDAKLIEHIMTSQVFQSRLNFVLILEKFLLSKFFLKYQKSAHQAMITPTILVINKVDCAPIDSIGPLEETCSGFFKKVVQTCAVTGEGISELEKAVLEVRGLEPISSGGRKWTVNQVCSHIYL